MKQHTTQQALRAELETMKIEDLKAEVFNERYNSFLRDNETTNGHKNVPFMGWFWRDCDLYRKRVWIAFEGNFVGVCMNNKWYYPDRPMTEDEVDAFISYVDRAIYGTHAERPGVFKELWGWMQGLKP